MKRISPLLLPVVAAFACLTVPESFAQNTNETGTNTSSVQVTNEVVQNTAIIPVPRDPKWVARHEGFMREAQKGGLDILFLGDSITDFWRNRGSNVWNKYYAPRHAANFGIDGDRTQHVLWRMDNGELDGIKPKVVVLMIGTNNTGREKDTGKIRNTVPETIEGVQAVVRELRAKLPDSKILLLAIFPRGTLDDPQRAQVALVNTVIAKLDDGKMVRYLDIDPKFLEADGTLPKNIMPDLLHPNERGYQIWAAAMEPTLDEILR
ncbi:MAG: platelet-activating factor acetylhydrolase IB subunit [Verrucomicrobiota bacterium]|jgi:lysophospholipase L1-like esterase